MKHRLAFLLLAIAIAAVPHARAADPTVEDLLARQHAIGAGMQAGIAPYADLPASTQSSIRADQRKLEVLLQGKSTLSQLAPSRRDQVLGLVAGIEAALSDRQQPLSCRQEARTGSNFITRVCRTPAEIREQKEAGERLLGNERSRIKCNDKNGCM